MASPEATLQDLATLFGVETTYHDMGGRLQEASPEGVLRVLRALGAPREGREDVPRAFDAHLGALTSRPLEPVLVAWDGGPGTAGLRLPRGRAPDRATCRLRLEDGSEHAWAVDLEADATLLETLGQTVHRLALPAGLPLGYHRLRVEAGPAASEALVLAAPVRAYRRRLAAARGAWGVFLPLYALESARSWGAGDFGDLRTLMAWVGSRGGRFVGILPILATFLGEAPHEPSPYAPASRLFWNEFFLDVSQAPEMAGSEEAQALLASRAFQEELEALREAPLVDYRRVMALKRSVLEVLARAFFAGADKDRRDAFRRFRTEHPGVEGYARFRAVGERQGRPWPAWPPQLQAGEVASEDYEEEAFRYHLYVQWLALDQVRALGEGSRRKARAVYLDLPLGVHADGYDTWRWRRLFVPGVSVGAPPDVFFTEGQDWGFPPLHPERIREEGYGYLVATLRHHMEHADYLRIDHIMGLHRLWWVPHGLKAREGAYVRYRADELYALVTLESHRNRCAVVGENLGTVPPYVNEALARHGLQPMYVLQYEAGPGSLPVPPLPAAAFASLNTHDMPPFAAFWAAWDVDLRVELGLLDAAGARRERRQRTRLKRALVDFLRQAGFLEEEDVAAVVQGLLALLAASPARDVLVNLEDLWLERKPQNVPGTVDRPNWRRKALYRLEAIREDPGVAEALRRVDAARRGG